MLELRPSCEHCKKQLPYNSTEARICSYECTFCAECAESVLKNTCPNCGGGFVQRPIRPAKNWKGNNNIAANPPSTKLIHKPVNWEDHARLIKAQNGLRPEDR